MFSASAVQTVAMARMIHHESGPETREEHCKKNGERGEGVNPCIVLTANHAQDARNRVIEGTNATGELKRALLDFVVGVAST